MPGAGSGAVGAGAEELCGTLRPAPDGCEHPDWAVASNDLRNGFNSLSRAEMLQRVHDSPFTHMLRLAFPSVIQYPCNFEIVVPPGKAVFTGERDGWAADLWIKPLSDGTWAVAFINKDSRPRSMSPVFEWGDSRQTRTESSEYGLCRPY